VLVWTVKVVQQQKRQSEKVQDSAISSSSWGREAELDHHESTPQTPDNTRHTYRHCRQQKFIESLLYTKLHYICIAIKNNTRWEWEVVGKGVGG
jgi:hypothetical protein